MPRWEADRPYFNKVKDILDKKESFSVKKRRNDVSLPFQRKSEEVCPYGLSKSGTILLRVPYGRFAGPQRHVFKGSLPAHLSRLLIR